MMALLDEEADINIFLLELRKDTALAINSLPTVDCLPFQTQLLCLAVKG